MNTLPKFIMSDYRRLLVDLLYHEYKFKLIKDFSEDDERTVYIRHDVDFFLNNIWSEMPDIEKDLGIQATYYFLLNDYNLTHRFSQEFIQKSIVDNEHDIGLHYDVSNYDSIENAFHCFIEELQLLMAITNSGIETACSHLPSLNETQLELPHYIVDPYKLYKQNKVAYISDSARAWRDEKLLECFTENRPNRLVLGIHPELWLSVVPYEESPIVYLHWVLAKIKKYTLDLPKWEEEWHKIFIEHEGLKAHCKRENIET